LSQITDTVIDMTRMDKTKLAMWAIVAIIIWGMGISVTAILAMVIYGYAFERSKSFSQVLDAYISRKANNP
jgi:hypothetical protein